MSTKDKRTCEDCGIEISDCNGFCNAKDFLELLQGKTVVVRELCGKCELRRDPILIQELPTVGDSSFLLQGNG